MITSSDVVCMGRIDHEKLVVVLAPPESYEPGRGYNLRAAHVYVGLEGEELHPLPGEATSMVDSNQAVGAAYVWCIQTSAGILVSTVTSEAAGGESTFVWSNAYNGGDVLIHPLQPRYFDFAGEAGGVISVASHPRQVIYAGANASHIIAVTAVGDVTAAEFYFGDATVARCPMARLHAAKVTPGTQQYTFHADLQPVGFFSYLTVEGYKRSQRELLGRREANRLFQTMNLPRKDYVGLFDGLLQAIDVRRIRFNQSHGIAWVE